jgi:hypothetical protein
VKDSENQHNKAARRRKHNLKTHRLSTLSDRENSLFVSDDDSGETEDLSVQKAITVEESDSEQDSTSDLQWDHSYYNYMVGQV